MMFYNDKKYKTILPLSLLSSGNNYRAKKLLKKIKNQEEVNVLFIGGSVTEGYLVKKEHRFSNLVGEYFKERFGEGCKVNIINEGQSGTDSICGLLRAESNMERWSPDMVWIEYAVNDRKDMLYREVYESLVVKYLKSKRSPCVILLFVKSMVPYSCQGHMKQVGAYYQVPMVSIGNVLTECAEEGKIEWKEYSDDEIHPNQKGNRLIADCILYYMEEVEKKALSPVYFIPEGSRYGNRYQDLRILNLNDWNHEKFEITLQFRSLFLMYIEDSKEEIGSVNVYVDGTYKLTLQGYSITGWGRPVVKLIMEEMDEDYHDVKICMAKGEEGKHMELMYLGIC